MDSIPTDRAAIVQALLEIAGSIKVTSNVTNVQKLNTDANPQERENGEPTLIADDERRNNNEYEVYEAWDDDETFDLNQAEYSAEQLMDPLIECRHDLQAELRVFLLKFLNTTNN